MARLRQALEDSTDSPRYLETLSRIGYRFIHPLQLVEPGQPAASPIRPSRAAIPRVGVRWNSTRRVRTVIFTTETSSPRVVQATRQFSNSGLHSSQTRFRRTSTATSAWSSSRSAISMRPSARSTSQSSMLRSRAGPPIQPQADPLSGAPKIVSLDALEATARPHQR